MNKPRSFSEQLLQVVVLAFFGYLLFQNVFKPQTANAPPPRPALSLAKAFEGIDPAQGPALSPVAALAEDKTLQSTIDKSPQDPLAYWARLRKGLIQQYVLKNIETKERKGGFLGLGAKVKYFPAYDEIISHSAGDVIDAQAVYQSGDLQWRQSIQNGALPSSEAASSLESLVHKGRGSSAFLDQQILVPKEIDPAKVPLDSVPAEGFRLAKVRDLRGTIQNPNPQGIPDRVNQFYSSSAYYKLFDGVVRLFGSQPTYSYGLAVLFFATITRSLLQPLTKRQYDSMKGMSLIAPEMKKIQERYKGSTEPQAQVLMMKEIKALQQRHGVNPMMGCGYALIQMPIFFVFVYPLIQHYEPKMELVGASFLWIQSLARPDIPLLILYGISMFFSFRLSSTPPTDDMQRQQQKIMAFVMPFVFPFFIASYPSAFTMYWMTYNAISTFFQWRMMKAADPTKNIIKTLMGSDAMVLNPTADAVPSRPTKGKADAPKALESGKPNLEKVPQNGSANGSPKGSPNGNSNGNPNGSVNGGGKNGKANKAALNGTILTPIEGKDDKKKK